MATNNNGAALVRQVIEEIWNGDNLDLADVLFSADYVNHGGLIPDAIRGPEAIKFSIAFYRAAFPKFRINVEKLVAYGDTVAVRWVARNVPHSARAGSTLTDAEGRLEGMTFSRLVGKQIAESWTCWDIHHLPRTEETILTL